MKENGSEQAEHLLGIVFLWSMGQSSIDYSLTESQRFDLN